MREAALANAILRSSERILESADATAGRTTVPSSLPRRAARAAGLSVLLLSTTASMPWVTPIPPTPQEGIARRFLVTGNARIKKSTILSYLPIQLGDAVNPAKIDLALKALIRTDLFSDAKVDLVNGDLTINVVENPIINKVAFEGNSGLEEGKLRDEVSVRPSGIFTKAKVQTDVQRIIELYRRSGYISATVTPKIVELPQERVDLIFEINEGPNSGHLSIRFEGNKEFSEKELRAIAPPEHSVLLEQSSTNSAFDRAQSENFDDQLYKYYRNRGFYDFRVVSAVAELAPDKDGFVVTYTLDEGPQYKFGKINVETRFKKLDKDLLKQLVPINTGDIYEDETIEASTDSLTFAAGAAGFASVDVRPRYTPNRETKTVDVTFEVNEGPRVYVNRIDIVGNTQTLDYVIRREMNLAEGEAYNGALVDRSKNDIKSLGFFRNIEIKDIPPTKPARPTPETKINSQSGNKSEVSPNHSDNTQSNPINIYSIGDLPIDQLLIDDVNAIIIEYKNISYDAISLFGTYDSSGVFGEHLNNRTDISDSNNHILGALDEFTRLFPGRPISGFISENFPDVLDFIKSREHRDALKRPALDQAIKLPEVAPELWRDRRRPGDNSHDQSETPPEFIKRVYGPWLGNGLTRGHIRRLDKTLYGALANWLIGNEMPEDVDLPKVKEQNDRWIDRVGRGEIGPSEMITDPKEVRRLASAMVRRRERAQGYEK